MQNLTCISIYADEGDTKEKNDEAHSRAVVVTWQKYSTGSAMNRFQEGLAISIVIQ